MSHAHSFPAIFYFVWIVYSVYTKLKAMSDEAIFAATCNAILDTEPCYLNVVAEKLWTWPAFYSLYYYILCRNQISIIICTI